MCDIVYRVVSNLNPPFIYGSSGNPWTGGRPRDSISDKFSGIPDFRWNELPSSYKEWAALLVQNRNLWFAVEKSGWAGCIAILTVASVILENKLAGCGRRPPTQPAFCE